jgi:hypothetical protein
MQKERIPIESATFGLLVQCSIPTEIRGQVGSSGWYFGTEFSTFDISMFLRSWIFCSWTLVLCTRNVSAARCHTRRDNITNMNLTLIRSNWRSPSWLRPGYKKKWGQIINCMPNFFTLRRRPPVETLGIFQQCKRGHTLRFLGCFLSSCSILLLFKLGPFSFDQFGVGIWVHNSRNKIDLYKINQPYNPALEIQN